MKKFLLFLFAFFTLGLQVFAQDVAIRYTYDFPQPVLITRQPEFLSQIELNYSDEARKNGVEGTTKVSLTLGADGQIKDVQVVSPLPFGVSEEAIAAVKRIKFTPALDTAGKPVALPMTVDFNISLVYGEGAKDVTKPKIIEKPAPAYPEKYRAEKLKDKVYVMVEFSANGTVKVLGANSTMPREFDKAAREAAEKIKFQPAVHKKTQKPVTQTMTVEIEFKP